jgi:hypothetical protein|tara:strand:+ start:797 stop:1024 length:228 start_codon:yes stop_codon:yes gene_type:complete
MDKFPINDETIINTIQFMYGEDVNRIEKQLVNDVIYVVYYNKNDDEIYRLYYEEFEQTLANQAYDNAMDLAERNR